MLMVVLVENLTHFNPRSLAGATVHHYKNM